MSKTRPWFGAAVFGAVLLAGLLAGCFSREWYEERAVARAREFLLENSPELTTEQRAFVRYNLPVLLVEGIFGGYGSALSDASQICPTWVIPGCEEAYLVFGVSDIRMQSWYPNRLIRKKFPTTDKSFFEAVAAARKYVQNGMYYDISAHEFNCTRFQMPQVRRTDFEFSLNPDGKADEEAIEKRKKLTQFSLVWTPREENNSVVVYGLAADPDLTGFAVFGGGVMSPEYLKKHTLEVLPQRGVSAGGSAGEAAAKPASEAILESVAEPKAERSAGAGKQ